MTAIPEGRFGNKKATAKYDSEPAVQIKTARGYAPDLNDKYYRHTTLKDLEYHIIAKEKNHIVIAAVLDLNALEHSFETERIKKIVPVACKRYNPGLDEGAYFCIKRELQCCRNQSHENIVRFYEIFAEQGDPTTNRAIWLVSERMERTLEKYYEHLTIRQTSEIDIRHMGSLLVQILGGLEYLHRLGTMHRNITPKTIGINLEHFEIKIIDFDGSREFEKNYDYSTNVETLDYYKSIEILMKEKYDAKVDIWSTAVVAIEMLGKKLFEPSGDENERNMKVKKRGAENVVKDRIFEVLAVPEGKYSSLFGREVPYPIHSSQLNKELSRMPRTFKHARFSFDENDLYDLMAQMLEVNRKLRPSADECLQHPFLKALNANGPERSEKTYDKKQSIEAKKELYKELDAGFTRLFFGEVPEGRFCSWKVEKMEI